MVVGAAEQWPVVHGGASLDAAVPGAVADGSVAPDALVHGAVAPLAKEHERAAHGEVFRGAVSRGAALPDAVANDAVWHDAADGRGGATSAILLGHPNLCLGWSSHRTNTSRAPANRCRTSKNDDPNTSNIQVL
jgi:hypothetical protein